jgi:hypothetical protein
MIARTCLLHTRYLLRSRMLQVCKYAQVGQSNEPTWSLAHLHWLWLWQDGATGLFMAALKGHKDVVQLLLELNADINAAKAVLTTDTLTFFHLISLLWDLSPKTNERRKSGSFEPNAEACLCWNATHD